MATGRFEATKYTGVRFRSHKTRRHGVQPDKYYVIRYKVKGKLKEEGLGWASQGWSPAKAHKIRSEITANIKVGVGPQSLEDFRTIKQNEELARAMARQARKSFSEAGEIYIEEYARNNKKSWKHDRTRFRLHLEPVLGNIMLDDLCFEHMEELKVTVAGKGLAKATVSQCLALTRQICNYSIQRGWLKNGNPVKGVKFPKLNNRRLRYCSADEEIAFFKLAVKRGYSDCHDICLLSLYTGMRMGEIFALTRQDIDLVENRIIIKGEAGADDGPKSGISRVAYITEKIRPMLAARILKLKSVEALLFPGPSGEMRREIGQNFKTMMKHLGWNKGVTDRRLRFCAHCFRHTFASRLVAKGVPLPVVKKMMGHATIQTTMRYTHTHDEQCRNAAQMLL
ncbi:site-specific integrase [Desulfovibrio sp. JC010]|uniref:tyrosine-type recombinase/integrase n=1 Tax=Desulfovibrio sp. JC010 TaxID=2593641 RepID=UPI0013D32151|nr:site-specific integrase [Desulfovibrio sp. JC010]NDV26874.1 tyrosine-type recombinase/integrase [Desulfovibrio sp. JC010]